MEIVVIGGGPGGYASAIYCAKLGMKVTLVENRELGGTCLNRGCIPTKVFVQAAHRFAEVREAGIYGVQVEGTVGLDFSKTARLKKKVVSKLRGGVGYLLEKAGVTLINGYGTLLDDHTVLVTSQEETLTLPADAIILATGSREIAVPGFEADGVHIFDSTQILDIQSLPERTCIIGGGVIGVEFASLLTQLEKKVVIVEMADHILPMEDDQVAEELQSSLAKHGVVIHTASRANSAVIRENGAVQVTVQDAKGAQTNLETDAVLVCVGRAANLNDIGLEKAGVLHTPRFIETNEYMQTSVPHIYAVGDITASPQLAHVAYHEALVVAKHLAGQDLKADYHAVPFCIFSHPEVARVGLTEAQARKTYEEISVQTTPFAGNGKAMIENTPQGFVKMVFDQKTQTLIGCSIIGPKATELIAEPSLAVSLGLPADTLAKAINAHPSLSEVIGETAAGQLQMNLHA